MIDRNELEDQMLKNLVALGMGNLEHAGSIARLNELLKDDYRGIIVTMIHKFRDMPANLNTRSNIYVLIDEAHRTTGGDLGNFLMAGLPNAMYLGLIEWGFTDKDVDGLIEHFRDPARRKEFFKEYKEIAMLYEIISPDAFLREFNMSYATLTSIYEVVRKAYTKRVYVDRDFQAKTNALVQEQVSSYGVSQVGKLYCRASGFVILESDRVSAAGTAILLFTNRDAHGYI